MKKTAILIITGILIIVLIITGVCVMLFHGSKAEKITELESLTVRFSGMRITEEYEITAEGEKTRISYYTMSYANGSEEKILTKQTMRDTQEVIDALNGFGVIRWDGFYGKHPRGVLDGTMFILTATVNGGRTLRAEGSQNFPKHFDEFEKWLYEILGDSEV